MLSFATLTVNAGAQETPEQNPSAQINNASHPAITYSVESSVTLSDGNHSPLWLNANKQGLSSINRNSGYLAAGIFRETDKDKRFSYGFGLELAGAANFTSNFIVQQAYLDLKYQLIGLSIGSKERYSDLVNKELSSGELSLSGNARPVPQVRVEIADYTKVPGTNGWLSFRGHVAYGRFTDSNWQKGFAGPHVNRTSGGLYHSKALYLKLGEMERFPLTFEAGIQLEAQFGGTRYNADGTTFKMPAKLKDFFKTLVPMAGGKDTPLADQVNIEGNQLGNYHFSLNYRLEGWGVHAYYEHYFEDHSMLWIEYPWKDGLVGVEITPPANRLVSGVVYEYIGSKDQTGAVFWDHNSIIDQQISARDNYYNHGFYGAWQHWGMALGNPLFTSPIYNKNGELDFRSNRIIAHHLGISGAPFKGLKYRVLISRSDNWGTYSKPFREVVKNTSGLLEVTYAPCRLPGWSFTVAGGTDRGGMLGDNTGGMVVIRKTGLLW